MTRYTIQDASDALGLPLPGITWLEGQATLRDDELTRFIVEHDGHTLEASAQEGFFSVRDPNGGKLLRPMSLFCRACSDKLDAALVESGWDEKIGHD